MREHAAEQKTHTNVGCHSSKNVCPTFMCFPFLQLLTTVVILALCVLSFTPHILSKSRVSLLQKNVAATNPWTLQLGSFYTKHLCVI